MKTNEWDRYCNSLVFIQPSSIHNEALTKWRSGGQAIIPSFHICLGHCEDLDSHVIWSCWVKSHTQSDFKPAIVPKSVSTVITVYSKVFHIQSQLTDSASQSLDKIGPLII